MNTGYYPYHNRISQPPHPYHTPNTGRMNTTQNQEQEMHHQEQPQQQFHPVMAHNISYQTHPNLIPTHQQFYTNQRNPYVTPNHQMITPAVQWVPSQAPPWQNHMGAGMTDPGLHIHEATIHGQYNVPSIGNIQQHAHRTEEQQRIARLERLLETSLTNQQESHHRTQEPAPITVNKMAKIDPNKIDLVEMEKWHKPESSRTEETNKTEDTTQKKTTFRLKNAPLQRRDASQSPEPQLSHEETNTSQLQLPEQMKHQMGPEMKTQLDQIWAAINKHIPSESETQNAKEDKNAKLPDEKTMERKQIEDINEPQEKVNKDRNSKTIPKMQESEHINNPYKVFSAQQDPREDIKGTEQQKKGK